MPKNASENPEEGHMRVKRECIEEYLKGLFGEGAFLKDFLPLGAGVHGRGFSLILEINGKRKGLVLKDLSGEGLGHDFPSDRAAVFIWAMDNYGSLPKHIKAIDVAMLREDASLQSIGGGKDYYLLMEEAEGINYFNDLEKMARKDDLDEMDKKKISLMTDYLAEIHRLKKDSKTLYWRKLRDTIGHGECLMGVFDTYPDGTLSYEEMAEMEKPCIDWRARLKPRFHRLCQIHGDFHPGNIWFKAKGGLQPPFENSMNTVIDFILLDRSRGPWGDAADDVTALTINYIFFSINHHGRLDGAYLKAIRLFFDEYIRKTLDHELYETAAPFYAFRGAVVANPVFYPAVSPENRKKLFNFVRGVLKDDSFSIERVNEYIKS